MDVSAAIVLAILWDLKIMPIIDTIYFFVFSTETIEKYGWDSVRVSYNILQRYDISLKDYNALSRPFPSFPPCDAMRDIKMWPPYGTYDENGHRVEQD